MPFRENTTHLEDLQPNPALCAILPDTLVIVVTAQWFGSEPLELMGGISA